MNHRTRTAFSLVEVLAALVLLALMGAAILPLARDAARATQLPADALAHEPDYAEISIIADEILAEIARRRTTLPAALTPATSRASTIRAPGDAPLTSAHLLDPNLDRLIEWPGVPRPIRLRALPHESRLDHGDVITPLNVSRAPVLSSPQKFARRDSEDQIRAAAAGRLALPHAYVEFATPGVRIVRFISLPSSSPPSRTPEAHE